jgi:xanthine dehydrogenase YagR molybdenum-binding subunit
MAGAARVNILSEAKARVTLLADGSAVVETDMTYIGTGTYAILTQIVGDVIFGEGGLETSHLLNLWVKM